PQVEADGVRAVELDQRAREQVLAVVLLAVVAAARLVDAPAHLGAFLERAVQDVDDLVALLDHREHRRVAERAEVPGLTAALGVERGAVQDHRRPPLVQTPRDHAGLELEQVRIVAIEALGHGGGRAHSRGSDCAPGRGADDARGYSDDGGRRPSRSAISRSSPERSISGGEGGSNTSVGSGSGSRSGGTARRGTSNTAPQVSHRQGARRSARVQAGRGVCETCTSALPQAVQRGRPPHTARRTSDDQRAHEWPGGGPPDSPEGGDQCAMAFKGLPRERPPAGTVTQEPGRAETDSSAAGEGEAQRPGAAPSHDGAMASAYLKPVPVLKTTTVSSGLRWPLALSLRSAATQAPPSGAMKMPSLAAASFTPWTISS